MKLKEILGGGSPFLPHPEDLHEVSREQHVLDITKKLNKQKDETQVRIFDKLIRP